MTLLPTDKNLTTNKLAAVFKNTAASYKFYWFISLLQLLSKSSNNKIPMKDILIKMICNAWYPVNYFKLNFGFSDKLSQNILLIKEELRVPVDINLNKLYNILKSTENKNVQRLILHFNQQVPHRFLYPWISGSKKEVKAKSQIFFNNCLYRLNDDEDQTVEINPEWKDYLLRNSKILLDFAYWNLLMYLQARNPNVPAIGSKLIKPITRNSLNKQKRFWDTVIQELETFHCIYTGNLLEPGNYDIEHFIPWSFVTHDQMWNLIPADSSINSSKSNKLPPLEKYLEPFVDIQHKAINIMYHKSYDSKLLEDYLILGPDLKKIVTAPIEEFKHKYHDVLSPLVQIAVNSGFEIWEE
jgi:hypothetical protein